MELASRRRGIAGGATGPTLFGGATGQTGATGPTLFGGGGGVAVQPYDDRDVAGATSASRPGGDEALLGAGSADASAEGLAAASEGLAAASDAHGPAFVVPPGWELPGTPAPPRSGAEEELLMDLRQGDDEDEVAGRLASAAAAGDGGPGNGVLRSARACLWVWI